MWRSPPIPGKPVSAPGTEARRLRLLLAAVFSASAAFAFAVASCREMDLIDLTGDDDQQARPQPAPKSHKRARNMPADDDEVVIVDSLPARSGPAKPAKPPKEELPPWQGLQGTKRVLSEFRHLSRACAARTAPCYDLVMPQEAHSNVWRFKLKEFDQDHPGGAALNADLRRLHAEHGVDHLVRAALSCGQILRPTCWQRARSTLGHTVA